MKVYSIDNILFTNAKARTTWSYKLIETMESNKAEMVAVAPAFDEFSADAMHRKHTHDLPPGRAEVLPGPQASKPRRYCPSANA